MGCAVSNMPGGILWLLAVGLLGGPVFLAPCLMWEHVWVRYRTLGVRARLGLNFYVPVDHSNLTFINYFYVLDKQNMARSLSNMTTTPLLWLKFHLYLMCKSNMSKEEGVSWASADCDNG